MTISVRIKLRKCTRTFSLAPCTATGTPCYNTRATCLDVPNYDGTDDYVELQLATGEKVAPGRRAYLLDLSHTSQKLAPNGISDFNDRINLVIQDAPAVDADDPYGRFAKGSWWSRLLARQPYMVGNTAIVDIDGRITHWEVSSLSYPDDQGIARIALQSPIPRIIETHVPSVQYRNLRFRLNAGTTNAGAVSSDVLSGAVFRIGDELIKRVGIRLDRGQYGTTPVAHDAGSALIPALVYSDMDIAAITYELLQVAGAGDFAAQNDFVVEAAAGVGNRIISDYVIEEPTVLEECLTELLPLAPMTLSWDAGANRIRPLATTPWTNTPTPVGDDDVAVFVNGSRSPPRAVLKADAQATRVFLKYGRRAPTDNDLLGVASAIDVTAESEDLYGRNFDRRIECSRLPLADRQLAESAVIRLLHRWNNRHRQPLEMVWTAPAASNLTVGEIIDASFADVIQDANGNADSVRAQIISAKMRPQEGLIDYKAISYLPDEPYVPPVNPTDPVQITDPSVVLVSIPTDVSEYDLRAVVTTNQPVRIRVTIGANTTIRGTYAPVARGRLPAPAFSAVGFHPDSEITVVFNAGSIITGYDLSTNELLDSHYAGAAMQVGAGIFTLAGTGAIVAGFHERSSMPGTELVYTGTTYAILRGAGGIVNAGAGVVITGRIQ